MQGSAAASADLSVEIDAGATHIFPPRLWSTAIVPSVLSRFKVTNRLPRDYLLLDPLLSQAPLA
jgi:hypothetical protein